MRIAIWHNLPSGGGKRALHDHVRGLVDRNHEVVAWCPPMADQKFFPLSEIIEENIVPLDWHETASSNPGIVDRTRRLLLRQRAFSYHYEQCAKEIAARRFDLLLGHPCQVNLAPGIARFVNIPSVLYLQEPNRGLYEARPIHPFAAPSPNGSILTNTLQWVRHASRIIGLSLRVREESENARAFDRILVNSLFSRESILRTYGTDSHVCYLGVDTTKFRPLNQRRDRTVVGLGSFQFAKGVDIAIEAIGCLPTPRPTLVWVANGFDTKFRSLMEDLAAKRSVQLRLEMNVSEDSLVDLLNKAAVMIYPSRLEPFGYAPLEAGACATPVVAIAEGGVRESVRDGVNGILVGSEPKQIAEAIGKIIDNPEFAQRLGESACRDIRANWNLPESIDRLERMLDEVLVESRRRLGSAN